MVTYQSINDTAKETGLSRWFLRAGVKAGTIPHIQSGNKVLVNVPLMLEKLAEEAAASVQK